MDRLLKNFSFRFLNNKHPKKSNLILLKLKEDELMKEYRYDEKSKLFFDVLANCGSISEEEILNVIKIPKNRIKSYVKKGLIEKTGWDDSTDKGYWIYSLTKKGRNSLKYVVDMVGGERIYIGKSWWSDALLAKAYLSLTDVERSTWVNRENLFETMGDSLRQFEIKSPKEYKELKEKYGFAPCNARYKNQIGEMVYVTVVSTDTQGFKKKNCYALMMKELSQDAEVTHYKVLRVRYGNYVEVLEW